MNIYGIEDEIVEFPTAKLLRKIGYNEWCNVCYMPMWTHNGEPIDEDEEFELRCEGRRKEIKIIQGGSTWVTWNQNSDNHKHVYSAPTQTNVMKWLRTHKNIDIRPYLCSLGWYFEVFDLSDSDVTGCKTIFSKGIPSKKDCRDSFEAAAEDGINYVLKKLL